MRRVKYLLTQIRRHSENEGTVSSTAGLSDDELIQYLNDAQEHLQHEIEGVNQDWFAKEIQIDVVGSQEAYTLPIDTYLDQNIISVEFSLTGNAQDYWKLKKAPYQKRETSLVSFSPTQYLLKGNQILLNPIPEASITNGLRIVYSRRLPRLDKRRGLLDAVTVSSGEVTALSLDVTDYTDYFADASAFSSSSILIDDKFCVVGSDGTVKAKGIPITAINESTGNATITSYTPDSTSETAAVGDYLVAGEFSTSHSEFPETCEKYLIHWVVWQILERDGNYREAQLQAARLEKIEMAILDSWRRSLDDVQYIPILNDDWFW